ncbi:phenylacetic acid degradation protein [Siccirubricoccus deserti]|uniref:PaaI family thioesterase n=1 Tax=Siccirubricoccus deserti TaxID=2013562 RepID=A0A9X0R0F0_9PROT|nr:PaaI family thioesterase [Siccirubricoccus deserti]MBC4016173.1 PaaI family thioesterase [Siccirubricoccus deserti]GGC47773.1 phenylacetic acid degradation protein [Siccirubricoccus deserti]
MPAPSVAAIQAIMREGVPLAAAWGIEVLAAEAGVALVRLPFRPDLLRPGNTVSGPALMGLADVAMWAALLSVTEGRDESVTSTMTVNFLRPAGAVPVLAEARLVKRGRRMVFGEIILRAEGSDDITAHVTTTWAVIAPAG